LVQYGLAMALGVVAGPILGLAQWTVLRGLVSGAGRWLWANALAWAVGMPVLYILPGPESAMPFALGVSDGVLYFVANDGVHGSELWRSDGTPEGTFLLHELSLGNTFGNINQLRVWRDELYFVTFTVLSEFVERSALWTPTRPSPRSSPVPTWGCRECLPRRGPAPARRGEDGAVPPRMSAAPRQSPPPRPG
jgi:ELWxxDGT repeat protein